MRLRASFLADNPICETCLESDIITPAEIAHHRVERLEDPRRALDRSNLVALCKSCHTRHHNAHKSRQGGG